MTDSLEYAHADVCEIEVPHTLAECPDYGSDEHGLFLKNRVAARSYMVVTSDGLYRECTICNALLDGEDSVNLTEEAHYAASH